jgi:two-component system, chemotaxis family, sensor kinase CheA
VARDPYKYFRIEVRELLEQLSQGALELEKAGPAPGLTARLLRAAHTLKGAARVVKQREIADLTHALEEALAFSRDSAGPLPRERIDVMLKLLDDIGSRVAVLTPLPGPGTATPDASQREEPFRTFRPDLDEIRGVLDGVAEAHAQLASMRPQLEHVERARHLVDLLIDGLTRPRAGETRRAGEDVLSENVGSMADELRHIVRGLERVLAYGADQIDRELRQVRDAAERLRLVPASALFPFLERAVRDVARAQQKRVSFEGRGGEVRVDAVALDAVQRALLQLVSNAVAHGIELADERVASGKPPVGCVKVEVLRRGRWVVFVCEDDGRGVDLEAVQRAVDRKGLPSADTANLGPRELVGLLLKGGISTSGTVTDVSGRGIGLDVVREVAERSGGDVTVRTDATRGTTVELVLPLSLASVQALVVRASGVTAAIPLDAIRRTVRVAPGDIIRTAHGEFIVDSGRTIPFAPLLPGVSMSPPPARGNQLSSAVVVEGQTGVAALSVDRVLGTEPVVLRPLPDFMVATAVVAGASLDAEGDPQLMLDPDGLVAEAHRRGALEVEPETPPSILVIDDSLTTRMLEQSILESAGYEVDLANSGEEGLEKARQGQYALFLVDVEMPAMDGFTFIERAQADPALRGTPSILVTSRSSPDDRRRGQEAGAQGYICKGAFDQRELLERIRTLVK